MTEKIEATTHACGRCGTRRPESAMVKVGKTWACDVGHGVTCAMQLAQRGYGDDE